jgi:hypothetical protein
MNQKLIEELEQTCLRLHVYIKRLGEDNKGFDALTKKTSKKGDSTITWEDKLMVAQWREYIYYLGKLMAYMFVLKSDGYPTVPDLIERLWGIKYDKRGAKAFITKNVKSIDNVGP